MIAVVAYTLAAATGLYAATWLLTHSPVWDAVCDLLLGVDQ